MYDYFMFHFVNYPLRDTSKIKLVSFFTQLKIDNKKITNQLDEAGKTF